MFLKIDQVLTVNALRYGLRFQGLDCYFFLFFKLEYTLITAMSSELYYFFNLPQKVGT